MEIRELFLQHYGKFENHRILLKPGVNIIYGGNETGKTTIHSFICAMLFGLSRARGKAARADEYQVRQPWDAPGAFLGSMKIESRGQIYRIDRCFDRSTRPLAVTCETTLWESPQPEQAMEVLLGGVGEAAFTNTLCIPQSGAETGEALAQELRRYMINGDNAQGGQTDVPRALQTLRRRKKQMEQQKKKDDEVLETQIKEKQARAEMLRNEISLLKRQRGGHAGRRAGGDTDSGSFAVPPDGLNERAYSRSVVQRQDQDRYESDAEDAFYRRSRRLIRFLLLLTGILCLAGAVLLKEMKIRIFLGICGVLFLIFIVPAGFLFRTREEEPDGEEPENQGTFAAPLDRRDFYLAEEIRRREEAYRKLQDELEDLYHSHVRLEGADTEIAALTLAIDRICDLSSGIYAQSGRQLNERASEILAELTQGRYRRILLDETAEVRIHTPSRVLGLHQVSGGTMQQIYFALRMASAELLCGENRLPILLDEPFALYDDERLEAALRWLKNSGRQVILFTCQRREREILERIR